MTAGDSRIRTGRSHTVKFIPAEGSTLFAGDRPITAILRDTQDPNIKKIRKTDKDQRSNFKAIEAKVAPELQKKLQQLAKKNGHSVSSQIGIIITNYFRAKKTESQEISGLQHMIDLVMFNIIEATDLILDEATPGLKERAFRIIQHSLKTLMRIRKLPGDLTDQKKNELLGILEDLKKLRVIAEEEERLFHQK